MAYLDAGLGAVGKNVYIWGRDVENVECGMAMRHANILPRIARIDTDAMRGNILKNTNLTNLSNDV